MPPSPITLRNHMLSERAPKNMMQHRDMYTLSGVEISDKDIRKYTRGNKSFEKKVPKTKDIDPPLLRSDISHIDHDDILKQHIQQDFNKKEHTKTYNSLQLLSQISDEQIKETLLQNVFASDDIRDKQEALKALKYLQSETTKIKYIQEALSHPELRLEALHALDYIEQKHIMIPCVEDTLHDTDAEVRYLAIQILLGLYTDTHKKRELILSTLSKLLAYRTTAKNTEIFSNISDDEKKEIVHVLLNSEPFTSFDIKSKASFALEIIKLVKDKLIRHELIDYFKTKVEVSEYTLISDPSLEKTPQELATSSPLYDNESLEKRFLTKEFHKTGSELYLLDINPLDPKKNLRNRAVKKIIDADSYEAWRHAFEAADTWKKYGFDYVPVEPIIKAKQIAKKKSLKERFLSKIKKHDTPELAEVYSRVIVGPTAEQWIKYQSLYKSDILKQISTIRTILHTLGVNHGHLHDNNFVVHFESLDDETPDISKPPRVYVIDFDKAVINSTN